MAGFASAQPRVWMPKDKMYFGSFVQGAHPKFSFPFRNSGDSDLVISDIKISDNDPSEPNYEHGAIIPYRWDSVTFVVNTDNLKPGRYQRRLSMFTNDPVFPVTDIFYGFDILDNRKLPKQ
jgi:hypothetical protein